MALHIGRCRTEVNTHGRNKKSGRGQGRVEFKTGGMNYAADPWPLHAVKWSPVKGDGGVQCEGFWKGMKRDCLRHQFQFLLYAKMLMITQLCPKKAETRSRLLNLSVKKSTCSFISKF